MDDHSLEPMWARHPPAWSQPPPALLNEAVALVLNALTASPRQLADRLLRAYDPEAGHPAALLEWIAPRHRDEVTAADLLAVAALGHCPTTQHIRRLLGFTPERTAIHRTLRSLQRGDLYLAGPSDLLLMEQLHIDVTIATTGPERVTPDRTAAAAALCARLRPGLFPLIDSSLNSVLGLPAGAHYRLTWLVMRHVLRDDAVNAALYAVEDQLSAANPEVDTGHSPLRLLEVVLIAR